MSLKKNDVLLILGLLLCAVSLWLFLRPGGTGAYVAVSQDGIERFRLPLHQDQTMEISDAGLGYNTLVIEDGKAYIRDADCGDHTCIHTGKISREGERIICLPHKLIIEIIGGDASGMDASTH